MIFFHSLRLNSSKSLLKNLSLTFPFSSSFPPLASPEVTRRARFTKSEKARRKREPDVEKKPFKKMRASLLCCCASTVLLLVLQLLLLVSSSAAAAASSSLPAFLRLPLDETDDAPVDASSIHALLVVGSSGYGNYRHQADVMHVSSSNLHLFPSFPLSSLPLYNTHAPKKNATLVLPRPHLPRRPRIPNPHPLV